MRRPLLVLHTSLAIAVLAAVIGDLNSGFNTLSSLQVLVLISISLPLTAYAIVKRRHIPLILFAGAILGMATRITQYDRLLAQPPEEWKRDQQTIADNIERTVTDNFESLCVKGQHTARTLSRSAILEKALRSNGAQTHSTIAFDLLSRTELPRSIDDAISGVTLYNSWRQPVAWTGDNLSWQSLFERVESFPKAESIIVTQGVFTYLIIIEPLANEIGFLTVEIPLIAKRRVDNRFLRGYDAISSWAGKSVSTNFLSHIPITTGTGNNLGGLAEQKNLRFSFPLRSLDGTLLGISSISSEDPGTAQLEARRNARRLASWLISITVIIATLLVCYSVSQLHHPEHIWVPTAKILTAFWGFRLTLLFTEVPLGFTLDIDNPAHYASALLFGLLRSPIDFLLTAFAVSGTAIGICGILLRRNHAVRPLVSRASSIFQTVVTTFASLLALLGINHIVYDVWQNSNLALTTTGLSIEPSLIAVQLGLILFFFTAILVVLSLSTIAGTDTDKQYRLLTYVIVDLFFISVIAAVLPDLRTYLVASIVPLLASQLLAIYIRKHERNRFGLPYFYFADGLLINILAVLAFYPSILLFEDMSIRQFIETTAAPTILRHGDSELSVITDTTRSIDLLENEGRLKNLSRDDLAYEIWASSDLAISALSSSVEVRDSQDQLSSRFALNFPRDEIVRRHTMDAAPYHWIIQDEPVIGDASLPGIRLVRRSIDTINGERWEIQVRLVVAWTNLPFIPAQDPYIDLFRAPTMQLSLPHTNLELSVLDEDGHPVFQSIESNLRLSEEHLPSSKNSSDWVRTLIENKVYNAHIFSDQKNAFVLSFPERGMRTYATDVIRWIFLSACIGIIISIFVSTVIPLSDKARSIPGPMHVSNTVTRSFYGKLYLTFILLALVPIIFLAFFVRSVIVVQLEEEIKQDSLERAQVSARFVNDFLIFENQDRSDRGIAAVSDSLLEWAASLVDADIDLYSRGELIATSKRELFDSGLLGTRAVPSAYQDIVLNEHTHSIHLESVGSFEYIVVSVPVSVEPWREPSILSLPLANREREINKRISSLNETVLLVALLFSAIAIVLAKVLARNISRPINILTQATQQIAKGDFNVSVRNDSDDEIGALFLGFTQMASDLKRERQRLERTKKLEAWAEMARQIAHEIKNPLTPIQLSTEHLLRVYDDAKTDFRKVLTDCTETIFQQIRTLRQISMEFSTFASPAPLSLQATNIKSFVQDTLSPYVLTPPDGVIVNLKIAERLPIALVDRRLLQRTLVNLIENALQALANGGSIEVHAYETSSNGADWVDIIFTDNGVGIEVDLQERIFEPYFSTRESGTGLGLAIARKVVEEHGGIIRLESSVGKGTRVSLRLPIVPLQNPSEHTRSE